MWHFFVKEAAFIIRGRFGGPCKSLGCNELLQLDADSREQLKMYLEEYKSPRAPPAPAQEPFYALREMSVEEETDQDWHIFGGDVAPEGSASASPTSATASP